MCQIYAGTDLDLYENITRSVRIGGVVTSVRIEKRFWEILALIAAESDMTLPVFLTTLYDEALELKGEVRNFSSLLRVVCTVYLSKQDGSETKESVALVG